MDDSETLPVSVSCSPVHDLLLYLIKSMLFECCWNWWQYIYLKKVVVTSTNSQINPSNDLCLRVFVTYEQQREKSKNVLKSFKNNDIFHQEKIKCTQIIYPDILDK